jgi:hypothetical protein
MILLRLYIAAPRGFLRNKFVKKAIAPCRVPVSASEVLEVLLSRLRTNAIVEEFRRLGTKVFESEEVLNKTPLVDEDSWLGNFNGDKVFER